MAERVREHFARHLRTGGAAASVSTAVADPPDVEALETLIDVAFWTSLRREEGYVPIISLACVAPGATPHPLLFAAPLRARAGRARQGRARRSSARDPPRRVAGSTACCAVWGATRTLPPFCLVLEVAAPGLLVVKQHRGGEHTEVRQHRRARGATRSRSWTRHASSLPDCPSLLTSLLGFDTPASWSDSVNVLVQLAVSMRAHKRGGLLLVVPADSDALARVDRLSRSPTRSNPPFTRLADLMHRTAPTSRDRLWEDALGRAIDGIAGLTAVDGATIVTDRYELLAFGAKITRRRGSPPVEQTHGDRADRRRRRAASSIPRRSAARGTCPRRSSSHDQHDAVALVASQDGRFTVFAWSPCENMVHAHRVEALLL